MIDTGKYDQDALYLRSASLHNWLFGLELPETVLLFTETMLCARRRPRPPVPPAPPQGPLRRPRAPRPRSAARAPRPPHGALSSARSYALAGSKKVALLQAVMARRPDSAPLSLLTYSRNKADGDAANYATLLEKLRGSHGGRRAALLAKEAPIGDAAAAWRAALAGATEQPPPDLGPMVSELLAVKDAAELPLLRAAGAFSAGLLSHQLLPAIESIVDEGKPTREARSHRSARASSFFGFFCLFIVFLVCVAVLALLLAGAAKCPRRLLPPP